MGTATQTTIIIYQQLLSIGFQFVHNQWRSIDNACSILAAHGKPDTSIGLGIDDDVKT